MVLDLNILHRSVTEMVAPEWLGGFAPGAVRIPEVLSQSHCERLTEELSQTQYKNAEYIGSVQQEFEFIKLTPPCNNFPLVEALRLELMWLRLCWPTLRQWRPNDIAAQRYLPGHAGIGPHRDFNRDKLLIAVFSLSGSCHFRLHHTPSADSVYAVWTLRPGDLVLLRGPGFRDYDENGDQIEEDRPIHSVSGPLDDTPRLSLAYRMNIDE